MGFLSDESFGVEYGGFGVGMGCIPSCVFDESSFMVAEVVVEEERGGWAWKSWSRVRSDSNDGTRPRRAHYRSPSHSATGHHGLPIRPPFFFHQQHNINGFPHQQYPQHQQSQQNGRTKPFTRERYQ